MFLIHQNILQCVCKHVYEELAVFCVGCLQKYLKYDKQISLHLIRKMLVRSLFKDKITGVREKPLEVQEVAAHSPPIFMQITN